MRRWLIVAVAIIVVALWLAGDSPDSGETRPNILLIVLDDLGYNDLGANGNPDAPTPNLDSFAEAGVRYTRHYADASCSVARVTLLTGRHPANYGFRPSGLGLSPGTTTIATALREAGYHTRHIGKWHVGNATIEQSPQRVGFDDWFGFLFQSDLGGPPRQDGTYRPMTYHNPWLRENYGPLTEHPGHLTDIFTDRAVQFLESEQAQRGDPWFLNLWYFAPHWPLQPAQRFRAKYPEGGAGAFYALVEQLDVSIGRVLQALEQQGLDNNTLVVILSDNGGTNKFVDNNHPFEGRKTEFLEGGLRTPLLIRWPGRVAEGAVSDELVSLYDIFPTLAAATGAPTPDSLRGRNLLQDALPPAGQLYWESGGRNLMMYSVLSSDGRWRLTAPYLGPYKLFDLAADPSGGTDVITDHPQIASRLNNDYLTWRRQARTVTVTHEPLNNRGQRILRGDDLQRGPGHGGFTFAIGVSPATTGEQATQTIVEQSGRWRLWHEAAGLRLNILGLQLKAPPLPAGQCSEVVVSSHFHFSPRKPENDNAVVRLFVNGRAVDTITFTGPELRTWGTANPTYIGVSAAGDKPFAGRLSAPLILNEQVLSDLGAGKVGNGVSMVPPTCPSDVADLATDSAGDASDRLGGQLRPSAAAITSGPS